MQNRVEINDFILNINSSDDKLTVPVKLGKLLPNEQIVCKAVVSKNTETTIVGIDNVERSVSFIGDFEANEYVRLINTTTTIVLIRLVDSVNLDTAVGELAFLKAATTVQEIAGTLDNVATTPLTNLLAFVERVNGDDSNGALAIANVRNGLLSASDKAAIDNDYMYKDPVVIEIKTEKTYKVINKSKWSKVINREKINEIKEVIQNHQNTINNLKDIIERLSA